MKRLLKISFDLALLSFIPIVSWFALSLIIDKNLINIFTLTYPIQFITDILKAVFSTGANISKQKDNNKNAVMSGLIVGSIVGLFIFGLLVLNIESYIQFMNMEVETYKLFCTYSVIQIFIQLIFSFVLNKLYYEDKNTLANKYSLGFNLLNFIVLIGSALLIKNSIVVIVITLIAISLYTLIIAIKSFDSFKLKFNLLNFIKYDSVELFNKLISFFIFLFGLSNALEFGSEYALALTFIALITDTQWDVSTAISVLAKIDISKKKFNYIEHRNNAYKLLIILFSTIFIMFITLYRFYDLNIVITMIFLSFEIFDFCMCPIYRLKTCYLQLEYSALKTTSNKIFSNILRMLISLTKTPYCTGLGQIFSSLYQLISINFIFRKNYIIDKSGNVINLKKDISNPQ